MSALTSNKFAWLAVGLMIGLVVGGFLPHAPLHAVATDRIDNFAIATGHVGDGIEAVFMLDFLTGNLSAAVINPVGSTIGFAYSHNILQDLQVDMSKSPKFLMVTGDFQYRGQGGPGLYGGTGVYIAEANSGMIACYALQFNNAQLNSANMQKREFLKVYSGTFRQAVVR